MISQDWMSLAIICILGAFSPGPSLFVILSITSGSGRTAGIFASIGHGTGVFLYALLASTGLALMFKKSDYLFTLIQFAGAAFLFYLGFRLVICGNGSENLYKESSGAISSKFLHGLVIAF